jgi:serine protein kinase
MSTPSLVTQIAALQDYKRYEDLHWSGSFEEYLEMVRVNPRVARTSHERLYDMVLAAGTSTYVDNKKKITRYKFFSDAVHGGRDAIFGLDIPLMRLVNVLKAAAMRYGTEKRIILLHGPVGSSKSTIVRLLSKASRSTTARRGALYLNGPAGCAT